MKSPRSGRWAQGCVLRCSVVDLSFTWCSKEFVCYSVAIFISPMPSFFPCTAASITDPHFTSCTRLTTYIHFLQHVNVRSTLQWFVLCSCSFCVSFAALPRQLASLWTWALVSRCPATAQVSTLYICISICISIILCIFVYICIFVFI